MASTPLVRHVGRPRDTATDAAILRAALELMGERGVAGTTLAAVARRAGVARATVYLRWPNRSALVGAAARAAVGGQPMPLTDDLEADVRFAAGFIHRAFSLAAFPAVLTEIVRGVLARPAELSFDSVVPRRRDFGVRYRRLAAAQGFDATVDPELALNAMLGTAIVYLLAHGRPMSEAEAAKLADVVIRGLRVAPAPENGEAAG